MSNWDLMMPGMGLTSIGLAGVVISYSGIAHTFIDGMHALTGLTMFIGLIFLAAGILQGGVSTSNKAKATVLVILSISFDCKRGTHPRMYYCSTCNCKDNRTLWILVLTDLAGTHHLVRLILNQMIRQRHLY